MRESTLKSILESRIQYYIDVLTINEELFSASRDTAPLRVGVVNNVTVNEVQRLFERIEEKYNNQINLAIATNVGEDYKKLLYKSPQDSARELEQNKQNDSYDDREHYIKLYNALPDEKTKESAQKELGTLLKHKEYVLEDFSIFIKLIEGMEIKKIEILGEEKKYPYLPIFKKLYNFLRVCFNKSFNNKSLFTTLLPEESLDEEKKKIYLSLSDLFSDVYKIDNFDIYPYYNKEILSYTFRRFSEDASIKASVPSEWSSKAGPKSYGPRSQNLNITIASDFEHDIFIMFSLLYLLDINPLFTSINYLAKQESLFKSNLDDLFIINNTYNVINIDKLFVEESDPNYNKYFEKFMQHLFLKDNAAAEFDLKNIKIKLESNHKIIKERSYKHIDFEGRRNNGYLDNVVYNLLICEERINYKILELIGQVEKLDEKKKQVFLEGAVIEEVAGLIALKKQLFRNNFISTTRLPINYLLKGFLQSITTSPDTSLEILDFLINARGVTSLLENDFKIITSIGLDDNAVIKFKNNLFPIETIAAGDKYSETDEDKAKTKSRLYFQRYGIYNEIKSLTSKERSYLETTAKKIGIELGQQTSKKETGEKVSTEGNPKTLYDLPESQQEKFIELYSRYNAISAVDNIKNSKHYTIDHLIGVSTDFNKKRDDISTSDVTFFMINDPDMRISGRNELELSAFLNTLSTIELSKLQPYLDVTLEMPLLGEYSDTLKTHLFVSTKDVTESPDDTRKRNNINSSLNRMSSFTTPQTLNNFYEKRIIREKEGVKGDIAIQDITRPFMSINSFTIDVAPTQGLMSFKTGKLSLTLHDKSRIEEVAAFVKPDMFGTHGSEITITYGWDGHEEYFPGFLNSFLTSQKVTERYIITNSSFNITQNGEVKIELSIAMRGPIDLKNTDVIKEGSTKFDFDPIQTYYNKLKNLENEAKIIQEDGSTLCNFTLDIVDKIYADASRIKSIKTYKDSTNKQYISRLKSIYNNMSNYSYSSFISKKTYNSTTFNNFPNTVEIHKFLNKKGKTGHYNISNNIISYNQKATSDQINDSYIALKKIYGGNNGNENSVLKSFISAINSYMSSIYKKSNNAKNQVSFLFEGINNVDPFYDRLLVQQILTLESPDGISGKKQLKDLIGLSKGDNSDFVSLGSIMTGLITLNLKNSGNYDDIQIVSYCANKNSGLMSRKNLASLLIRKEDVGNKKGLRSFLFDLFSAENIQSLSLEGLLTRLIEKFINTNANISYGLSDLFKLDNNVLVPKIKDPKKQKLAMQERLKAIYDYILYDTGGDVDESSDYEFIPPKLKFSFDTRVSKKNKTILRISIYDENDNPFKAISDIFIADKNSKLLKFSTELGRIKVMGSKKEYKEAAEKIIEELIDEKIILPQSEGTYTMSKNYMPLKRKLKRKIPSLTYGTQNSAIIDASVTTVNEAKLNTVFMTRSGIKTQKEDNIIIDDLPLNVLPAQATATIFGCPFINFAQMLFLDFETNTTLDNIYAVTGIKHDISPGKFTTSLTLTYGDIYGKYRAAVNNISTAIQTVSPSPVKLTEKIVTATPVQKSEPSFVVLYARSGITASDEVLQTFIEQTVGVNFKKTEYASDDIKIIYYTYIKKGGEERIQYKKNYGGDLFIFHELNPRVINYRHDFTDQYKIRYNHIQILYPNREENSIKLRNKTREVSLQNYYIYVYEQILKDHIDIESSIDDDVQQKLDIKINFIDDFTDKNQNHTRGAVKFETPEPKVTTNFKDKVINNLKSKINSDLIEKIKKPEIKGGNVSFPNARGYFFTYSRDSLKTYKFPKDKNIEIIKFTEIGIKSFIETLIKNYTL